MSQSSSSKVISLIEIFQYFPRKIFFGTAVSNSKDHEAVNLPRKRRIISNN